VSKICLNVQFSFFGTVTPDTEMVRLLVKEDEDMSDFSFLKRYILPSPKVNEPKQKHYFYPLKVDEVEEAEKRMNRKFPKELREFYEQIGYGFMWQDNENLFINRLMDPHSIADFILGEDFYEDYYVLDVLEDNPHFFPFFEVGDDSYMYFDLSQQNDKGICPVIYEGLKVASSLEEFLRRLDQKENYYIYFDVINYTEVKK
jgi:hypothetical protein